MQFDVVFFPKNSIAHHFPTMSRNFSDLSNQSWTGLKTRKSSSPKKKFESKAVVRKKFYIFSNFKHGAERTETIVARSFFSVVKTALYVPMASSLNKKI